jgi:serine/threonine-protein kinase
MIHPTPEQIAAFGLGKMDEAEALAIESHLAECSQCARALEKLPDDNFLAGLRGAVDGLRAATERNYLAEAVTLLPGENGDHRPEEGHFSESIALAPELVNHPRYRIVAELGAGGMGVVFKAEHLLMERPVALKIINRRLTSDPGAVERFRREVRSAARLGHPNIVTVYDAEQAGDLHFLVMEFVEGISLDRLVARQGPLPVMQACDYVVQVAQGLQHALERGLVHRDIKPQNLLMTSAPGRPWGLIKILDFGLALFAHEKSPGHSDTAGLRLAGMMEPGQALTVTGTVMGTPDYVAPEQIRDPHAADVRADIYSLGCTLYFLLTGQVCFPNATVMEKLIAQMEITPCSLAKIRTNIPPGLVQVFEKMTAKDARERYQTPDEVARALVPFTTVPEAIIPTPEASSSQRRQRSLWPWRALVAAAFCGMLAFCFWRFPGSKRWVSKWKPFILCVRQWGNVAGPPVPNVLARAWALSRRRHGVPRYFRP